MHIMTVKIATTSAEKCYVTFYMVKYRNFECRHSNHHYMCVNGFRREPRGFGFVQYRDPADAADAQFRMDRQIIAGREITVVFAEDNRKKPSEMRVQELSR